MTDWTTVAAATAREILIQVAQQVACTSERKLYDALAQEFDWPKRDTPGVAWRDEKLYPVLRAVSDQNLAQHEPLLWSLVLADPEDNKK